MTQYNSAASSLALSSSEPVIAAGAHDDIMPADITSEGFAPVTAQPDSDGLAPLEELPLSDETDSRVLRAASFERSVLVYTHFTTVGRYRSISDRKTSKGELINADMNKDAAKVTKDLFPKPKFKIAPGVEPTEEQNAQIIAYRRLKALDSLDTEIRNYIERRALPSPLRKTVRIVPIALLESFGLQMREFETRRAALVADFLEVYPLVRAISQENLGELFEEGDYPSEHSIAHHFSFEWKYVQMGLPDADSTLFEIDASIFERNRAQIAAQWQDTQRDIEQLLRLRLQKLLDKMVERLSPPKKGEKQKVFRDSLLGNIDDFMRDFDALNITNNAELTRIGSNVRALLSGINPKMLRTSADLRAQVIEATTKIDSALSAMIVDEPDRAFRF